MYGEENWRDELGVSLDPGPGAAGAAANDAAGSAAAANASASGDKDPNNSDDKHAAVDPLNPRSIQEHLANYVASESNNVERTALNFLKDYVFANGSASDMEDYDEEALQDLNAEGAVVGSEEEAKRTAQRNSTQMR